MKVGLHACLLCSASNVGVDQGKHLGVYCGCDRRTNHREKRDSVQIIKEYRQVEMESRLEDDWWKQEEVEEDGIKVALPLDLLLYSAAVRLVLDEGEHEADDYLQEITSLHSQSHDRLEGAGMASGMKPKRQEARDWRRRQWREARCENGYAPWLLTQATSANASGGGTGRRRERQGRGQ